MKSRHRFAIAVAVVGVSALLSLRFGSELPKEMVTNWDTAGEPNETMSRSLALWLLPAVTASILVLFALIPRIDPLRENIASFRQYYDYFVIVLIVFLSLLHAGILAFNLGYEFPFVHLVVVGVALLFYYVGIVLAVAERNWFVGIRTPWTLSSDEVWNRTHAVGSRLFKLTAGLALIGLLFGELAIYFVIIPAVLTAVVTTVYSFYLYERVERTEES